MARSGALIQAPGRSNAGLSDAVLAGVGGSQAGLTPEPRFDDANARDVTLFFGPNSKEVHPVLAANMQALQEASQARIARDVAAGDVDAHVSQAYLPNIKAGTTEVGNWSGYLGSDQASGHLTTLPSGHQAFEVSDAARTYSGLNEGQHRLSDVLQSSDDLYAAYPGIGDTPVIFDPNMGENTRGYYDPSTGTMVLNANRTPEQIRSTVLHETQHVIDKGYEDRPIEGWRGTAQADILGDVQDVMVKFYKEHKGDDMIERAAENTFKGAMMMQDKYFNEYQSDQGESLARLVQARQGLTPEQLRNQSLVGDLDVPVAEQKHRPEQFDTQVLDLARAGDTQAINALALRVGLGVAPGW